MKSPQIVHFRCLDTFGVRDVAQSYGAGATGVRLTETGLAAYVRPSRRKRPAPEVVPASIDVTPARARAPRASMPSLVTIEMGLRRPTTWAVLLLTLGVSLGAVIARLTSGPKLPPPAVALAAPAPPSDRVSWPQAARAGVPILSTLATTTIRADLPDPTALQAHASSARTRALHSSHHRHHAPALSAPASSDEDDATSAPAPAAAPVPVPALVPAAEESDDSIGAASAASARARKELSDAL